MIIQCPACNTSFSVSKDKFGTKNMDVFNKLYSALERRIYNTKNLLSEDNLDNEPH